MDDEADLTPDVASIAEFLAMMARGYDNRLKWNEQDMFKADLMNAPQRWRSVDVKSFKGKCVAEGMRSEDATLLVDWLVKAKSGRRLIPSKSYRGFIFQPPPQEVFPDSDQFLP